MRPRRISAIQAIARRFQSSKASNAFIWYKAPSDDLTAVGPNPPSPLSNPLSGREIAIKDNICTVDFPTTCASHVLRDFRSPYDATVVEKLRHNGAVICGKTNMDEFGMGSHSTHSVFGAVHHISDGEVLSAGGSSGGSAMAVATGQCWAAIGTDTGGSVRLPAAYTGVFGFKPSYGLISRWGVVAYANSLDTVGILANDTSKIRDIFSVISGYDENDPTSLSEKARMRISAAYQVDHGISERPLRIGVPLDYNITDLDPEIRHTWTRALEALQSQSHVIVPTSLPSTRHALSAYYILAPAEASSNLARYDGVRFGSRAQGSDIQGGTLYSKTRDEGLGAEVKRRILLGSYTLSSEAIHNYFLKAQEIRRLVQNEFDGVFKTKNPLRDQHEAAKDNPEAVDVLLCPTAPNLPPKLSAVETLSPVESYMTDVFTVPASLAGLPAISIPVRAESGLGSVGMQIIGQFGADALVLDVASLFEKSGLIVARSGTASSSQLSTPSAISDKACASESNLTQPGRERRFSEELANAYFNHQRVYGRGIKAVQYYRERGQRSPLR